MSLWRDFDRTRDARLLFLCLWWLAVLVLAQLFDGHHNHYLFFALLPASLGLGIFLDKLIYGRESNRVLAWTQGSLIVGCGVIAISGVALPLLAFYQLPEVRWHYAGFGVLAVAGAVWISAALRRWSYGAVVARLAILLLVVDLHIQGFIFPIYNRFQTRPMAEKLGTIVKAGDSVAIYQTDPLDNYFNFYSDINRIEHIENQQALSEYLSRPGGRFLLVKQRVVERLQLLRSAKSLAQLARFSVGMAVQFDTDDGRTISGTVARLNQRTATVVTPSGRWRVSPSLLRAADASQSAGPRSARVVALRARQE